MKRTFALGFLMVATLLLANTPPTPEGTQAGRYQLAAGTSPGARPGDAMLTMFRIDTATGKTWYLHPVPMNTANGLLTVTTWTECHEVNGQLYRAAIESMQPKQ